MTKLPGISQSAPHDWKVDRPGLDLLDRDRGARRFRRTVGRWVEAGGPRRAMFTAGLCWAGGLIISALGVYAHQSLADVSRLWRDRRLRSRPRLHLAGVDPDQVVPGSPRHGDRHGHHGLRRRRVDRFAAVGLADATTSDLDLVGVWETFITLGVVYFVFMMVGAVIYSPAAPGWKPDRLDPPRETRMITSTMSLYDAHKTPQFWLIWWVLCSTSPLASA